MDKNAPLSKDELLFLLNKLEDKTISKEDLLVLVKELNKSIEILLEEANK